MNFLALRIDERNKLKLRRWWYHTKDDCGSGLWMVAIFVAGVVVIMTYGLWPR